MGTIFHIASGTPLRVPGANFQRRTAAKAALSNRSKPLDRWTSMRSGIPLALTKTRSMTLPCSPMRRLTDGYAGRGLFKYAALLDGITTPTPSVAPLLLAVVGTGSESAGAEGCGSNVPVGALAGAGPESATAIGNGWGFGLGCGLGFGLGCGLGIGLGCCTGSGGAKGKGSGITTGSGSGVMNVAITSAGITRSGALGLGRCCKPHKAATCETSTAKVIVVFCAAPWEPMDSKECMNNY